MFHTFGKISFPSIEKRGGQKTNRKKDQQRISKKQMEEKKDSWQKEKEDRQTNKGHSVGDIIEGYSLPPYVQS